MKKGPHIWKGYYPLSSPCLLAVLKNSGWENGPFRILWSQAVEIGPGYCNQIKKDLSIGSVRKAEAAGLGKGPGQTKEVGCKGGPCLLDVGLSLVLIPISQYSTF